jgi:hypothetical protein
MAVTASGNVKFQLGSTGSPTTWTDVGGVTGLDGPNQEQNFVDVTDFDSVNNTREYVPGLNDVGEMTLSLNYDPNSVGHQTLEGIYDGRTLRKWRVRYGAASPYRFHSFSGYIQSLTPSARAGEIISAQVTIRVTGAITRS